MIPLTTLIHHIDHLLRIRELPDYAGAMNGLQLENRSGQVSRIAAAVDATLPVVKKAIAAGADLLIVHHGMFWNGTQPWTGAVFERLSLALEHGLAIYSAHLPLDVHPSLGNNARLAKALGWTPSGTFLEYKGLPVGLTCQVEVGRDELVQQFSQALGGGGVHVCAGGPQRCGKIGISTGGSGSEVAAAARAGVDTFLTGEGPHWSYTLAEELGINVLYGGHYATETFGVKALAEELELIYKLPWSFIDHPTGL
jgi:dinuclear metal center YbgI/SA1388 family protein